jgi:hypothetical protein
MKNLKSLIRASVCTALLVAAPAALAGANIVINNVDPVGVGFNDTTPADPVGGNIGITVGEQRLIAYQYALDLWGARLNSAPTITVIGSFAGLGCNATGGTLAQAGATTVHGNFTNAPVFNTWYGGALANSIAGTDLNPDVGEIVANFNGNLGQPDCLAGSTWYYGLDNNPPAGGIDFLNTFMHEVAHGLGFQNFMNESAGTLLAGFQDIYTVFSFDNTIQKSHAEMNDEERIASSINSGNVVWTGAQVAAEAGNVLADRQFMEVYEPGNIASEISFGFANFGPSPTPMNFDGRVVLAEDGAGLSSNDGCEPLTNGNDIAGNIALIDRGACGFTTKAFNAQEAGAVAVIVANNVGPAIGLGGSSAAVTIPTVGVGLTDGNAMKAELANGVMVRIAEDPTQLAGADAMGRVQLNAPNPVQPGSSISHYDPAAVPNLLMEPAITGTLTAATDVDLTDDLFADIGWSVNFDANTPAVGADCQVTAASATIEVLGCDTGIANTDVAGSCKLGDIVVKQVADCVDGARNHGQVASCTANALDGMKKLGLLNGASQGSIQSCVAGADVP